MTKQFPPTQRRLEQARLDGDTLHSAPLSSAALLMVAAGLLAVMLPAWSELLSALVQAYWSLIAFNPHASMLLTIFYGGAVEVLHATLPLLALLWGAAALIHLLQVRPLWTLRVIWPQASRLSPEQYGTRLKNGETVLEAIFQTARATALVLVAVSFLYDQLPLLFGLSTLPFQAAFEPISATLIGLLVRLGFIAIIFGVLDLALQRHLRLQRLSMTRVEVEREQHSAEPSPLLKRLRQRLRRFRQPQDGLNQLGQAHLIVAGPTSAIALRYNSDVDRAPVLVARATSSTSCAMMMAKASEGGMVVVHDEALVKALLDVPLGGFIPNHLFAPAARMLVLYASGSSAQST